MAALRRRQLVHAAPADAQFVVTDFFQARDHAQQRGLATARRADEDTELTGANLQVHVADDRDGAVALLDSLELDACPGGLQCFETAATPPGVS
jgi:hypothetical protein